MKRQTTTKRALAIRKTTAARKHQKGFAMEWIIIVLLVAAALVPVVMLISNVLQGHGWTIIRYGTARSEAEAGEAGDEHGRQTTNFKDNELPKAQGAGQALTNSGFGEEK